MLTDKQQMLVNWLARRKVATMRQLRHQFQLSHMTVIRTLKKYGYYTSYNYNAAYYTLHDVPQFDDCGLWIYRDIRFSRHRTFPETIVALVERAPEGLTVRELETRLQTRVANLLCRLVRDGRLTHQRLRGRQMVYLARDSQQANRQHQQRLEQPAPAARLPEGCSAAEVIDVLREMVLSPRDRPHQLTRKLKRRGLRISAGQVRRVIEYYALQETRLPSP